MQSKRTDLGEEKIKNSMNVQKEEIVEHSLELVMGGENGEIVERKIKRAKIRNLLEKKSTSSGPYYKKKS